MTGYFTTQARSFECLAVRYCRWVEISDTGEACADVIERRVARKLRHEIAATTHGATPNGDRALLLGIQAIMDALR